MSNWLTNWKKPGNTRFSKSDIEKLHNEDSPFMAERDAALLMGTSQGSHLILITTIVFFVTAVAWAALARIDEVTHGDGKVIPSSKLQVVQNLEGGILTEILVSEGEVVSKGQPLLRLDDTYLSSTYRESRLDYFDLFARAARLTAEANNTPLEMPKSVWSDAPDIAKNEVALYESRVDELRSNLGILEQQEAQIRQEITELHSHKEKLARSYQLVKQELTMSEPLEAEGAISEVEILRLRRSVNDIKGELDASRLAIPRMESELVEMQSKVKDLEITFRTQARAELNEVAAKLSSLEETLHSKGDRVRRTIVNSPVNGEVKQILVATVGGVIQPGMDLIEIVPMEGNLLVEAHVRPADIAFLRPDQDAEVKLTAYDFAIYGGLPAKLEHISADTITDENGESFYLIRVRTERSFLGSESNPLEIIPGMTAVVDILTGQKSVLDYLLKPVLRAREMALRER
jgi:adhesin transport system membrane fusion protein